MSLVPLQNSFQELLSDPLISLLLIRLATAVVVRFSVSCTIEANPLINIGRRMVRVYGQINNSMLTSKNIYLSYVIRKRKRATTNLYKNHNNNDDHLHAKYATQQTPTSNLRKPCDFDNIHKLKLFRVRPDPQLH